MSEIEHRILKIVSERGSALGRNIFNTMINIYSNIQNEAMQDPLKLLEDYYKYNLSEIKNLISEYFKNDRYNKVLVIADNLDVNWKHENNLFIQSEAIKAMIDLSLKLNNEFKDRKGNNVQINTILFIRKDIYEYIKRNVEQPDKLLEISYEINWKNYPNKLNEMLEARIRYILGLNDSDDLKKIWSTYFDEVIFRDVFKTICANTISRPRDILFFVSKLFESAIDNGHKKVIKIDLEYAIDKYSNYLIQTSIAELKAEIPKIDMILSEIFITGSKLITYKKLRNIFRKHRYYDDLLYNFIYYLVQKEYVTITIDGKEVYIKDISDIKIILSQKKYYIFMPVIIITFIEYICKVKSKASI